MQKALQDFVHGLGHTFEISLQKQAGKWHGVQTDKFKGAYIFKEIKFADALSIWLTVFDYKKWTAHTFRHDSRNLTEDETAKVEKARLELDEKLAQEKKRVNEECRQYCIAEFSKHSFTTCHEYLERKGVVAPPNLFKSRINEVDKSDELLCPIVDAEKKFWGYQIISKPRDKDFNIGQKTDSCFIPLGGFDNPSRIYVAEGVATGLSGYMALEGKFPVACSMSAGNLPKVVKALRKAHPKTPIIILADNDQWSKDGQGYDDNAGVKALERALSETDGTVGIAPQFPKDHTEKPTDWNDWHRLHGLDNLKSILDATKPVRPEHFWPLGHNKGVYYFTNLRAPEIHATKDFSSTDLYKIVSLEKWKKLYPEFVNAKDDLDEKKLKSKLIDMAQKKGHFRADDSRGVGIYLENGKSLVHLGDRVFFEGAEVELQDFESEQFYDLKFRRQLPERESPTVDMQSLVKSLRSILGGYTWENPLSPELILGWIYCAYASGGLAWRPHILVSAKAGSGKSTIASLIVEELLKYSGYVKKEDATEAGVRQELENNAVPLIHDEFDTNKGEPKRLASVLNLLRAASSGGSISRGTPSGKALKFEARFCAYLTGINPPNLNEADQTRICVLRLLKQNPRPWHELEKEILTLVDSRAARGVFWQVVDSLPNFVESAKTLQKCLASHGERVGQQYGALLAGFWHLFHVEQITLDAAQEYVKKLEAAALSVDEKLTVDDNAERCLEWLLAMRVRVSSPEGSHEMSVGQILETEGTQPVYERELGILGIKRLDSNQLFIAGHTPALESHFEKTQWQNYVEALMRIPNAQKTRLRVGGRNSRGVQLSLPSV